MNNIIEPVIQYRLNVDESGTHQYPNPITDWNNLEKRYLALTGVIFEEQYYQTVILLHVHKIKLLVASNPKNLPILHRSEMLE